MPPKLSTKNSIGKMTGIFSEPRPNHKIEFSSQDTLDGNGEANILNETKNKPIEHEAMSENSRELHCKPEATNSDNKIYTHSEGDSQSEELRFDCAEKTSTSTEPITNNGFPVYSIPTLTKQIKDNDDILAKNGSETIYSYTSPFKPISALDGSELIEFPKVATYDYRDNSESVFTEVAEPVRSNESFNKSLEKSPEKSPASTNLVRETDERKQFDFELEKEIEDTVCDLKYSVPPTSRSKNNLNRLSIISMASSIAAIAPFIRSIPSESSSETSPNEESKPKASTEPKCKKESKTSNSDAWKHAPTGHSNLDRLNELMQRAVTNSKSKRNSGITEQTIKEWSNSLESCFDAIPENNISLDVPQLNAYSESMENSRRGFKTFSGFGEKTKKYRETWVRFSHALFGNSENKEPPSDADLENPQRDNQVNQNYDIDKSKSEASNNQPRPSLHLNNVCTAPPALTSYKNDDACSFVTAPDSEADELASARTSPPSLTLTGVETSTEQSLTCATIGSTESSYEHAMQPGGKRKRRQRVARFFKSIFGSPIAH